MLSTIIYRSHLCDDVPVKTLKDMVAIANKVNEQYDITGILLFNGNHFFQLLEGPEEAVNTVYARICKDKRHHNVVELMRDYAPSRRFGNVGMELFELRDFDKESVLQAVLDKGTSVFQLTYDDRPLQFLRTFVEAREKENYYEVPPANTWDFVVDHNVSRQGNSALDTIEDFSFTFQPIIDPFAQQIVSLQATMQNLTGETADEKLTTLPNEDIYQMDLRTRMLAFAQAGQLGMEHLTLSINLLPMTLVMVPDAVDFLLAQIREHGFVPEQIVVAFTESDATSRIVEFETAIKHLKSVGISLAIDDFGAGAAGLLLLTRFQPDKIIIDRHIIHDVHKSGPKQAIIQAIITCCASLEIAVIAKGVEQPEEWMWLEAAGICHFQGSLFAAPQLNGIPAVSWPEKN